jgi:hypothetical protein
MTNMQDAYKIVAENPKERNHVQDLGASGRMVLKWLSKKYGVRMYIGFNWPSIGPVEKVRNIRFQ